jgi:hypothetical protein
MQAQLQEEVTKNNNIPPNNFSLIFDVNDFRSW